ncbi:MAG: type II secretion system protein GspG [Deltaproteobacteria bacterium]|nr:type II secretion system protein GspG [Deltaproteobacteria bacterium]
MARRRQKTRVSLPWERRGGRWRGLIHNTRWQALLGLAAMVILVMGFTRYARHRVQVRDTRVAIAQVKQAIDRFQADVGRCPGSNAELLHPPLSQKHYLDTMPKDGWGRSLSIRCPGYFEEEAEVISAGPSGSLLKDDNIQ